MSPEEKAKLVRQLNDEFRSNFKFKYGSLFGPCLSPIVSNLSKEDQEALITAIRAYKDFDDRGFGDAHDEGVVGINGMPYIWKINYEDFEEGSDTQGPEFRVPSDPRTHERYMIVMYFIERDKWGTAFTKKGSSRILVGKSGRRSSILFSCCQ